MTHGGIQMLTEVIEEKTQEKSVWARKPGRKPNRHSQPCGEM